MCEYILRPTLPRAAIHRSIGLVNEKGFSADYAVMLRAALDTAVSGARVTLASCECIRSANAHLYVTPTHPTYCAPGLFFDADRSR